jgi:hypothetical protein
LRALTMALRLPWPSVKPVWVRSEYARGMTVGS